MISGQHLQNWTEQTFNINQDCKSPIYRTWWDLITNVTSIAYQPRLCPWNQFPRWWILSDSHTCCVCDHPPMRNYYYSGLLPPCWSMRRTKIYSEKLRSVEEIKYMRSLDIKYWLCEYNIDNIIYINCFHKSIDVRSLNFLITLHVRLLLYNL